MKKSNRRPAAPLMLRLFRRAINITNSLSSRLAGRLVYWLFFTAKKIELPKRYEKLISQSEKFYVRVKNSKAHGWYWGQGRNVLLVHGWSSRGIQLAEFVEPLLDRGYKVIMFDAIGHGESDGRQTDIMEICDTITGIQKIFGDFEFIIAHSFGATCSAYAVNHGVRCRKLAMISTPVCFEKLIGKFQVLLQIPDGAIKYMKVLIKRRFGFSEDDYYKYISADFNLAACGLPVLVVHDKKDREVPVEESIEMSRHLKNSTLILTARLGHQLILRDSATVNMIVNKLIGSDDKSGIASEAEKPEPISAHPE